MGRGKKRKPGIEDAKTKYIPCFKSRRQQLQRKMKLHNGEGQENSETQPISPNSEIPQPQSSFSTSNCIPVTSYAEEIASLPKTLIMECNHEQSSLIPQSQPSNSYTLVQSQDFNNISMKSELPHEEVGIIVNRETEVLEPGAKTNLSLEEQANSQPKDIGSLSRGRDDGLEGIIVELSLLNEYILKSRRELENAKGQYLTKENT